MSLAEREIDSFGQSACHWHLYTFRCPLGAQKIAAIVENAEQVAVYRIRLADVSWLMKTLREPIARRANAEDKVKGRFWEGRFKS